MNKHLKVFVSVLFIVIIILAICITRFYFDVSKDTENRKNPSIIYSKNEEAVNNLYIFESENNLFGVVDENDNIILEPQWKSVEIEDSDIFIVSDAFKSNTLYGCVDSEGNTKVPFIYSSIQRFGTDNMIFYVGKVLEDDSFVVYDNQFSPCFDRVWDNCDIEDNKIKLYYNDNVYSYFVGDDGISLKSAVIKSETLNKKYSISFMSRVILSKLDYKSLEKIAECISAYIDFAFKEDYSCLTDYVPEENFKNFRFLFSESPEVFSKEFNEIKDVSVYQEKYENGNNYITASVKVNSNILFSDNSYENESLEIKENYRAVVKFEKKEFGSVEMISASFSDDEINREKYFPKE